MSRNTVTNLYYQWLCDIVCDDLFNECISYGKLLTHLHNTEFTYRLSKDSNRAEDGIGLRYRFEIAHPDIYDAERYLDGPCSVLEMMVALAIRCEENIMDDPSVGDRTKQWFWSMVTNLGLGAMDDGKYDEKTVDECLTRFLNREYMPNGKGGLFTVRHCTCDLRDVEIWHQLCWYLDGIA